MFVNFPNNIGSAKLPIFERKNWKIDKYYLALLMNFLGSTFVGDILQLYVRGIIKKKHCSFETLPVENICTTFIG